MTARRNPRLRCAFPSSGTRQETFYNEAGGVAYWGVRPHHWTLLGLEHDQGYTFEVWDGGADPWRGL